MKKTLLEEEKIVVTIKRLRKNSFSILNFVETFKKIFPDDFNKLTERFGLFGEKKRYTIATYLANRLYIHSHKPSSVLKPFQKYSNGVKRDYRIATKEERESFGSRWMAIYRKKKKGLL